MLLLFFTPLCIDRISLDSFITSANEVMFSPGFVCGFVSLFVNKITLTNFDEIFTICLKR